MIGTVVVPLDGSELAEQALPFARGIARRTNAPLHLVSVLAADAAPDAEDRARDYLRGQLKELSDRVQISIRRGNAAEEIIKAAEEVPQPLIVMTTHGRSGVGRWVYGSVADRVVRGTGVPVLLVRSGTMRIETPEATVQSIVLSLDGSTYAEAAIPYAAELAQAFGATIHLVRVAETAQIYGMLSREPLAPAAADTLNELGEQLVREAQDYLAKIAEQLRGQGVTVETECLEGFAADQLLAYEKEVKPDLVVMATHGRSGLSRLVFGSVAERMLRMGTTPVLMINPPVSQAANG